MAALATNKKQQRALHADKGAIRFCHRHPRAVVFCTFRRLEQVRLRLHYARPRVDNPWPILNRDFETSVRVIARMLQLDQLAPWVLSCADSEGGRGAWVPNRAGSGAGGWMQFLSGTFYNNALPAWRFASSRGVHIPRRYLDWHSAVGQAVTALWMFKNEGSGQWYGAGC